MPSAPVTLPSVNNSNSSKSQRSNLRQDAPTHVPDANGSVRHTPRAGTASAAGVTLRAVVLGWCLWLLGAWAGSLWIDSPVPAARWMLFSSLIGLTAVWPTVRLSLDGSGTGTAACAIFEWIALIAIFQIIIWTLALTAQWPYIQALWLDLAIAAWSLLTALLVAVGLRSADGVHRVVTVVLCLLLLLAEPMILALADVRLGTPHDPGWFMRVSPIQTIWALSETPVDWSSGPWRTNIATISVAAVVAWCLYGLLLGSPRRRI